MTGAVKDQLVLCGLVDGNFEPRPATLDDLSRMLGELEIAVTRSEFRRYRHQRKTILAIVEYWKSEIETRRVSPNEGATVFRLPNLVEWRRRIHIDQGIARALRRELGLSRTAAHNLTKRQLELLNAWGLVEEIEDG